MHLLMTGLDCKTAELAVREKFAAAKEQACRAAAFIKENCGADGVVVLSTCNRTEVYASLPGGRIFSLAKALCSALDLDFHIYQPFFAERADHNAIAHLCRVAAGLESQILGDDQIITQVREALENARASGLTDSCLETMFRLAVKAAKVIKTNIALRSPQTASIAWKAAEKLKTLRTLSGQKVLVIGNGQMGQLLSGILIQEGAEVTVTLREYKKGAAPVPKGASIVRYSERYAAAAVTDIIVSATASPHYTLRFEDFSRLARLPAIVADLAVPRDVEPAIGNLPGVVLFTGEDLTDGESAVPPEKAAEIEAVIAVYIEKYKAWLSFRNNTQSNAEKAGVL